jgi:hypothetical protein
MGRLWVGTSVAAIVLVGCGGATSTERATRETTDAPPVTDAPRASHGCPARFGETGPSCTTGDDPGSCAYPEGTCACIVPTWCGGAAPPHFPPVWTCTTPQPPCPEAGTPCDTPGASCNHEACAWMGGVVCTDGTWTIQMSEPPP